MVPVIGRYYSSGQEQDKEQNHKTTECYLDQVANNLCTIFQVCVIELYLLIITDTFSSTIYQVVHKNVLNSYFAIL